MTYRMIFPFAAVVGQERVKKALLLAVVNPKAGGVLITGEKGAAKSTLVRGLAQVIPAVRLVNLPLNATEDMVFGSLDIEKAVASGQRHFSPGILSKANGNILYIDEVNLLNRDLMNAILDTVATGINIVEREGISYRHEAHCIMIGTMNPEEGELPSHLLDRFGLYVAVTGEKEVDLRIEVLRRIVAYERQPDAFRQQYEEMGRNLCRQVEEAQEKVAGIVISEAMMQLAAQMCGQVDCAGHRAELFLLETAKAIAALAGRDYVLPADMQEAATFVLPHRMRQQPQQEPQQEQDNHEEQENQEQQDNQPAEQPDTQPPGKQETESQESNGEEGQQAEQEIDHQPSQEQTADIGKFLPLGDMMLSSQNRQVRQGSGKRTLTKTNTKQGRYVRSCIPRGSVTDIAFDATLRAAAPYQQTRANSHCYINICQEDLRQKVREKRIGSVFLFVVDASGSMGAKQRMKAVKGAILSMLQDAYQKRDKVGMIAFRRQTAEVLLPVTRSVDLAQKCLERLPTGGKTPLGEGLCTALEVLQNLCHLDKDIEPVMVLVTDGRANAGAAPGKDAVSEAIRAAEHIRDTKVHSLVIDTEQDFVKLGIAKKIAQALGGSYYKLEELSSGNIIHIVNGMR
jgi:magnesium chelatase subunit D